MSSEVEDEREESQKPLFWVASSRDDLRDFPEDVKYVMGYALYLAQKGGRHASAKPLKGFGGAGVLEIVTDDDGTTFRAVYAVKLPGAVYVLDAFQKKSKRGVKTPQREKERIRKRLKAAEEHHRQWLSSQHEKEHAAE